MKKEEIIIGTPVWYYPILGLPTKEEAVITSGPYEMCGTVCCNIDIRSSVVCIDNLEKKQYRKKAKAKMKNVNKLTYHQICLLASQNRFNEIPAEYNIVWTGHHPCKFIEDELKGNCLKFIQNEIPIPTKINVKGEYIVDVPFSDFYMLDNTMEFGDIFINTYFSLTELKFIYENKENIEKMKPYLEMCRNGYTTGREPLKKKDINFSVDLTTPDYKIEVINLFLQNCIIEDTLIVYFGYDYCSLWL